MANFNQALYTLVSWTKPTSHSFNMEEIKNCNDIYDKKNLNYTQLCNSINEYVNDFKPEFWVGIQSNTTINNKHYGFFEFDVPDMIREHELEDYKARLLSHIIKNASWLVGNSHKITIYSTKKGYHVISYDLWDFDKWVSIARMMGCCQGFVNVAIMNGFSTLRVGCKENREDDIVNLGTFTCNSIIGIPDQSLNDNPMIHNLLQIKREMQIDLNRIYKFDKEHKAVRAKYVYDDNYKILGFEQDKDGHYISFY